MKVQTGRQLLCVCIIVAVSVACASDSARDHTSASDARADSIIHRDLTAYFSHRAGAPARVTYTYLRVGPTITGIAYPKYYVWVRAEPSVGGSIVEGPARVALIDSTAEVTHFFVHDGAGAAPAKIDSVFPAPVAATIRSQYWK